MLALFALTTSWAGGAEAGQERVIEVSWSEEVPVTMAGLSMWIALGGLQDGMGLDHCGWCAAPGPVDRNVRAALLAPHQDAASVASHVLGFGVLGGFVILADVLGIRFGSGGWKELGEDVLIMAEAFALTVVTTQLVKISVRRPRPYLRYGTADGDGDAMLGFFSGHSAIASSAAASAATLAFLRGRSSAPLVTALGALLAVGTGLLRIAADRHYLSDVLAGLAVGTAAGILVPYLHLKRTDLTVLPGPASLTVIF